MVQAFVATIQQGARPPIDTAELFEVAQVSIELNECFG